MTCSKPRNFTTDSVTVGWKRRPPFVRADGGVELHAVAAIDLYLAGIIGPCHAEFHEPLRFHKAFEDAVGLVFGMIGEDRFDAFQHLVHRLQEFRLIAVAPRDLIVDALGIFVGEHDSPLLCSNTTASLYGCMSALSRKCSEYD
jgi:hypothetical protein